MTDSNLVKAKPVKNEKWENYGKKPVGWFVETQPDVTWADRSQEQRMARLMLMNRNGKNATILNWEAFKHRIISAEVRAWQILSKLLILF